MITGTVSGRRAYVPLVVHGGNGQKGEVEFVLDTGFTGVLTLPPVVCVALSLTFERIQPASLADSSPIMLRVYEASITWDAGERAVEVLAMEGAPLIGMALLDGFDVQMQVTDGGLVTIEPL